MALKTYDYIDFKAIRVEKAQRAARALAGLKYLRQTFIDDFFQVSD